MWAYPNLASGAVGLTLRSLLTLACCSCLCFVQNKGMIILFAYSSCCLSTSGSHSKGLYFSQALGLGPSHGTLGFAFVLSDFLLNNCLCFEEESWGLFLPI